MKFNDVFELLDKGFSPEQIVELSKAVDVPEVQPTKTPESAAEIDDLKNTIANLQDTIKSIQDSNLQSAVISNAEMKKESASDILAQVFYNTKKEA